MDLLPPNGKDGGMMSPQSVIAVLRRICNLLSRYKNCINLKILGIKYGKHCVIHGHIGIHLSPTAKITIGDYFYMSSGGHRNPLCANNEGHIFVEDNAVIRIGNHVGMSSTVLWCAKNFIIGNHVNIGANVKIMDTDAHSIDYLIRRNIKKDIKEKHSSTVVIEDDVLIGVNSIILKGVTIGARSVIGAGSIVTKSIPPDCIAAGNPAKVIKYLK